MTSVAMVEKPADDMAEAIPSDEFAPSYRSHKQFVAQRHDVSRTPTLEALRQLTTTGPIDVGPRRPVVCRITPADPDELFVTIGELATTRARLAVMSMSPAERRRRQTLHERARRLADHDHAAGFSMKVMLRTR